MELDDAEIEPVRVQGLGETEEKNDEVSADPLGLLNNLDPEPPEEPIDWARRIQAEARAEAEELKRESGPKFLFGAQNTATITDPDFSGLAH